MTTNDPQRCAVSGSLCTRHVRSKLHVHIGSIVIEQVPFNTFVGGPVLNVTLVLTEPLQSSQAACFLNLVLVRQ